jgi:hypothetical protein
MFYNTIDLSGEMLKKEWAKTLNQEKFITEIFKCNPNKPLSPSQILNVYNEKYQKKVPITSIRRAMTDLTKSNVLRKTSVTVTGLYNLPEHCWVYEPKAVVIHWD